MWPAVLWGAGRDRLTPIDAGAERRHMSWGGRSPRVRDVQVEGLWMRSENYRTGARRNRSCETAAGGRREEFRPAIVGTAGSTPAMELRDPGSTPRRGAPQRRSLRALVDDRPSGTL